MAAAGSGQRVMNAASPRQGAMQQVRDRDLLGTSCRMRLDIYFVGYERGGERGNGERGRAERERELKRGRGEGKRERDRSCLFRGEMDKGRSSGWKLKEDPQEREWVGFVS